jgi:hypothetical protein
MNNTLIKEIETLIINPSNHPYKFPDVCAHNMIMFERAYTNNYHHPILLFVRQDIKVTNNYRTYYLYEKDQKTFEIIVISINGIVSKYAKPFTYI